MAEITEDCFFFPGPGAGSWLYGCLYLPATPQAATGILVAPPLGRERLRVYRELACTSRVLASHGHAVLRFDYRGEGESTGRFQDATLASRAEDLAAAAGVLRERSGCHEVCPLGVREGALVALIAAGRLAPRRIILCEPICNPEGHARNLIRSNIVLQQQYHGKAALSSADVIEELKAGAPVSIYGFQLGQALIDELERCRPEVHLEAFRGQSALIYFAPREVPPKQDLAAWRARLAASGGCEAICVVLNFSWATKKIWDARLSALDDALVGWLERTGAA